MNEIARLDYDAKLDKFLDGTIALQNAVGGFLEKTETKICELETKIGGLETKLDGVLVAVGDVHGMVNNWPLTGSDMNKITKRKNAIIVPLLGGKKAPAYKNESLRSKVYADIAKQINREFAVTSYKDIPSIRTSDVLEIIDSYCLPRALIEEIEAENAKHNEA